MALPLIPIIAGAAIRTIARKAIPKLLKTANVGTLGYVGYEAGKEAKKGNYEPLGDLAQSYLLRGAPTLLKAKGAIVIDKNVGAVRSDKQTYLKQATKDPLAKGRVVFDVKGNTTPAKTNTDSYNYQRKGKSSVGNVIKDTSKLYQESVKQDVKRSGTYTKDIKIDDKQASLERRAVVSGVRKEIKDAEKRGDPYTEFFMPVKTSKVPSSNIWWSSGENKALSNLALRPFKYQGKEYKTVEQAYQTLKTGKFDEAIYSRQWGEGVKIRGGKVNKNISDQLMKDLIKQSFKQNPKALAKLKETGSTTLTHRQDKGHWGTKFPEMLTEIRGSTSDKTKNAETVLRRYLKRFFPSVKVTDVKATKATTKLAKKGSGGTDVTKIDTPQETLDKASALSTVAKYTYAKDRKTGKGIFVDNPFSRNKRIEYQNIVGRDEVKNIIQTENIIKQTPTSRALSYMRFLAKSSKTKGLNNKIITNVGSGIPLMDDNAVALLRQSTIPDTVNLGKTVIRQGVKKGSNKKARELMGEVGGTGTRENVGAYKKFEGSYSPVNRSKEPNVDAAALRKLFAGYFNRNKPKNPKK